MEQEGNLWKVGNNAKKKVKGRKKEIGKEKLKMRKIICYGYI